MKVFCIIGEKGELIAAYPRLGIAKVMCRKELKDRVIERDLVWEEKIMVWATRRDSSVFDQPRKRNVVVKCKRKAKK